MDQDAELTILLNVEAVRQTPLNGPVTAKAITALHNVVTDSDLPTTLQHTDRVKHGVWSGDNKRILTVSSDNIVKVWDAVIGQELLTLYAHHFNVTHAAWNTDDSHLVTASKAV